MRNKYDLGHLAHVVGHIGRLQTLTVIPVVAGESLSLHIDGVFRLAPTRKEIVSECQLDVCAFFVPHRHVWGAEWLELVQRGIQASAQLSAGPAVPADARDPFYLGIKTCGANINKALNFGYNEIYRRYFAVPTTTNNGTWSFVNSATFYPTLQTSDHVNTRRYGARAARLPHILNGGIKVNAITAGNYTRSFTQADWGVQIPQDTPVVGTALLDIRDLNEIQSRYASVQEQNYFATFYTDVISRKWNTSGVNTDADQRPTYLGRQTQMISGTDINGTDDATLGSYAGKTLDRFQFHMPRRFMPEHGNVWVMILPRFPLVHTKEQHPLLATAQVDNKLLLADPTIWQGEPVVPFDPGVWLSGGSAWAPNVAIMQQPYGQEYRWQPNRVHPVFESIPGYPFIAWDTAVADDWYYYKDNEYDETFETSQVEHWQAHARVKADKLSPIPGVKTSIFAGAS